MICDEWLTFSEHDCGAGKVHTHDQFIREACEPNINPGDEIVYSHLQTVSRLSAIYQHHTHVQMPLCHGYHRFYVVRRNA